jgi:hypothetical protein
VTCTVYGIAAIEGGTASYHYRSTGRLERAEAVEKIVEELPSDGVPLDLEHSGATVGEMIYGELDERGALGVVCIVDDPATAGVLADGGEPVYLSPSLLAIGAGLRSRAVAIADAGALAALSLTLRPAGHGLHPIGVRAGDVRSSADRATWPLSWRTDSPLLTRAVEQLGDRGRRVTRLERHADPVVHGHGWVNYDGRPCAGPGPQRGATGRILGVR